MASRKNVVSVAEAELGYLEKSLANWNKYGTACLYDKTKYAGSDNVQRFAWETGHYNNVGWAAWCMSFVVWAFMAVYGKDKANELLCGMFDSASTMDTKDAMVKAGRQVPLNMAEPGDIVFRSRKGGGHVGLVVGRSTSGQIISVEGNSSSTDITSWNGGAVVKHTGASWEWCCRPDWSIIEDDKTKMRWVYDGKYWYYQDGYGRNTYGWKVINHHWYAFDGKGKMRTGVFHEGDKTYYLQESGDLEGACCKTDESGNLEPWYVEDEP